MFRMPMKMASLFCGAVIVLSFVAGRAGAQIDSNSTMTVHSGDISAGCTMTITSVFNDKDTSIYNENTDFSSGLDFSGNFASETTLDSFPPNQYIAISIDSVDRTVTLSFHRSAIVQTSSESGENDLQVTFDSLPYVTTLTGGLAVEGAFIASYQFGAFRVSTLPHSSGGGTCNSGGQTIDSVLLEITPKSGASINSSIEPNTKTTLASVAEGISEFLRFLPSDIERQLRIYNMLGSTQLQARIASGVSQFECPSGKLPPGCYFARLGDQLAKFVVPPG